MERMHVKREEQSCGYLWAVITVVINVIRWTYNVKEKGENVQEK